MMDCRWVLWTLLWFTGFSGEDSKETTEYFDCCDLPKNVSVDRRQENEFTIGNKSVAIVSENTFDATPPFKTNGDNILTLDQCVDFRQKNVYLNEEEKTEENFIDHRSKPCDLPPGPTTGPTTKQQSPHNHTGLIGVVVLVFVVVIVFIWIMVRGRRVPEEMV